MCSFLALAPTLLATSSLAEMTCIDDYHPGNDGVIFTTPYIYAQVMPIIGSFKDIT
jgi:hypothetical protein